MAKGEMPHFVCNTCCSGSSFAITTTVDRNQIFGNFHYTCCLSVLYSRALQTEIINKQSFTDGNNKQTNKRERKITGKKSMVQLESESELKIKLLQFAKLLITWTCVCVCHGEKSKMWFRKKERKTLAMTVIGDRTETNERNIRFQIEQNKKKLLFFSSQPMQQFFLPINNTNKQNTENHFWPWHILH